jgi:hypothetical protein
MYRFFREFKSQGVFQPLLLSVYVHSIVGTFTFATHARIVAVMYLKLFIVCWNMS